MILDLDVLWKKYESSSNTAEFPSLKDECIALDRRLLAWKQSRAPEFLPTEVGNINKAEPEQDVEVGYWPGRVDSYFDLYIAGVWNIFRTAQILLAALIVNLCDKNTEKEVLIEHINAATLLVSEVMSSIPYNLADNIHVFLGDRKKKLGVREPGRTVGGLLLMHPLYIASSVPFLPEVTKGYLRRCLLWIGSEMGIEQATLLATVSKPLCTSNA